MIYLDNAATTPMLADAVGVYQKYACQSFYNPSAGYREAQDIAKQIKEAKERLLVKLGATCGDIIYTSGATESNNLAIMGSRRNGKWEYVFSVGEHPSVYNVAKELEMQGFKVHFVGLSSTGEINYEMLASVVNEKTRLVSVMHISNETGAVNDIQRIVGVIKDKARNALIHVDGVQAFCKVPICLNAFDVDFYTISAHKFHGPKGVGALYVKNQKLLKNIVFGGGQENGLRSGTENVAGIMAMDYVANQIDILSNYNKVQALKACMVKILSENKNVNIFESKSPYILSVGFKGVNGETLMRALQDQGVIVGMGSACSAKKSGNRILESIGFSKEDVKQRIRISFNSFLSEQEVAQAGKTILKVYNEIWEKVK
ncbi:MAG: cysteine desulfurase [Clostridiales bacterium]|nr:cysteine desulfurase [Clostridiales bacterium]